MDWVELIKFGVGLIIVIISLGYTIRHFKILRTVAYIERFNNVNMIEIRAEIEQWARLPEEKQIESLNNNIELYYKINLVYSLITEIGISYRYRIIHRKMTRDIFNPLIPLYWLNTKTFINYNRENGKNLGRSFKELVDSIIEHGGNRLFIKVNTDLTPLNVRSKSSPNKFS